MTKLESKRVSRRLGVVLAAVPLALVLSSLGAAPGGSGAGFVATAFAQDRGPPGPAYHGDPGHPPPPDEMRRREEAERLERERHRHYEPPPPPAYVYTPPPVYYAPAAPSLNLDFIFPLH
ncbi:MAG TPA: hypothetical protein VMF53_13610 [Alphaproteobacteria bacterium]|nr:hypothetical protein [Alphaproteobacteria bacterium]